MTSESNTKATRTPAPWTLYKRKPTDAGDGPLFHVGNQRIAHTVCEVREEANARLIAAAPQLLAACKDLTAFVGVMFGAGPDAIIPETVTTPLGIGIPVKLGDIMREAQAAIARAEGVSS